MPIRYEQYLNILQEFWNSVPILVHKEKNSMAISDHAFNPATQTLSSYAHIHPPKHDGGTGSEF